MRRVVARRVVERRSVVEALTVVSVQLISKGWSITLPASTSCAAACVGRSEAGCGLVQRDLPCRPISLSNQAEQQLTRVAAWQVPGRRGGAWSSGRRAAPASGAADGEPRRGEEGAEQGAAAAGSAQRLIHFNMVERHLALLQRLMAAQQGVHQGNPGGLGRELTAEELDALYRHATRFRCESARNPLLLAPDEPDA